MVKQALNRHSQIVIPPETKYFFAFLGHSRRCQARHLRRLRADLDIELPDPPRRVTSPAESRAFFEQMARLYLERIGRSEVACFGDKTPEHAGHLDRITRVFPKAKIIFLYRDGRDVALSLSRMPWMSGDLGVCFCAWLYYFRLLRQAQQKNSPDIYFARYEEIVRNPEQEFSRLLSFLGLDFESAVVNGHGNVQGLVARELPWKYRALNKISQDRIGLFARELNLDQVRLLERLGRNALPALGYPLRCGGDKPLPVQVALKLAWNFARWTYQLPWHCIANEFAGRAFLCDLECELRAPAMAQSREPNRLLSDSFPVLSPV